ncbi:hypothetical protein [Streptomyces rhizosphaericola]|uniref:hypothetical protein n=1 Tax=Streptomyces rhizosphaericola TaxID=2564098 RepID=UPI001F0ECD26|nr:hypothetical protein [Streptomyces rhizosphaericola]
MTAAVAPPRDGAAHPAKHGATGPDVHDAGLLVARRLIGTGQLVDVEQVLGQLDTRVADPVLE